LTALALRVPPGHLPGMNVPILLAAEVVGENTPVTVGLMLSVVVIGIAWGETRAKLAGVIKAREDDATAYEKQREEDRREIDAARRESQEDRKGMRTDIDMLKLSKERTDMRQQSLETVLGKIDARMDRMDGKLDKVLEIDTQNARRRSGDHQAA
jgi:hypothetical protein